MAYRDDEFALQTKKAEIEGRLAQIEVQRRELEGLSREEADLGKELADVKRRLEERRRLPLLSRVEVAAPCHADWDKMVGDDRTRFCPSCEKKVYNLSAMTTQEAEQLIHEKGGNLCAKFYRRKDGTVMTADCPEGVRSRRARRFLAVLAVGAGAVGASMGMPVDRRMGGIGLAPERPRMHAGSDVLGQLTQEQYLMHEARAAEEAEAAKKAALRAKALEKKNEITKMP
ncbi:hypothetical protein [Polyangium sp. 15x6]|uniref:hypothetical protein n=1 Tax=Polyangium sp. 15x6 TaxID=3042687 RepID=UPI00249C873B|nr:hypothetical protein [Polyangium sp. 15x6]MDI3285064.1 hypothetical protein [Polyangium sp. 15x6]